MCVDQYERRALLSYHFNFFNTFVISSGSSPTRWRRQHGAQFTRATTVQRPDAYVDIVGKEGRQDKGRWHASATSNCLHVGFSGTQDKTRSAAFFGRSVPRRELSRAYY